MPFKIIRSDITKIQADAIVNTANPKPTFACGTDRAIYEAAGVEKLLEARKEIGVIKRGEIAVTPAFDLDAKHIIHTVGPVWNGGNHGEFEILESCYVLSLQKAIDLGCESIAFPLIATGVYGFPKEKALQIALSVISRFLLELEQDIQVYLVVYDQTSCQLSEQLVGEIDSYIDENYESAFSEYEGNFSRGERYRVRERELSKAPDFHPSLEDSLETVGVSFHDKLFELIQQAGIDNKDVWKLANLNRKHFSKIQCDANYHPKKRTVMALCIALRLDLEQAKDLLARADWAFSPNSKFDLIVQKSIIDKQYDIAQVNAVLFRYTNEILGI